MTFLIVLIILAALFGFLNAFHDSSNVVATIISSRAMAPRLALGITALAEFIGPFLAGVAVAKTIGEGIVAHGIVTPAVLLAALVSAILWNLFTWFFGIPSSSSHALIGGLLGAVAMAAGFKAIQANGVLIVLVSLFITPMLGGVVGYLFTRLVLFLARKATPKINLFFKSAQIVTGIGLALSHSANDAQKTMGVIALGMVATRVLENFQVPLWVVVLSAAMMALGTLTGAARLIRTLGGKFYKIRPLDGFVTQISAAAVIFGAALVGGPVSTTQVVSSAILGVGVSERFNKVRWGVAGQIALAWVLTIPLTMLVAAAAYWVVAQVGR